MRFGKIVLFLGGGLAPLMVLGLHAARGDVSVADQVVSYSAGAEVPSTYWGQSYAGPGSSWSSGPGLGLPVGSIGLAGNTGEGIFADDSFVTPFGAQYNPAYLVGLGGAGGYLEVHLSKPVPTTGYTLGVHAGVGLYDVGFPNGAMTGSFGPGGTTSSTASTYTDPRSAEVLVSAVGGTDPANWVALNNGNPITFDAPTNYYTDLSDPYSTTPGTHIANFDQPFLVNGLPGTLASFDGNLDWQQTLAVLDGSAGGTWLDLSHTGLSQVNYVAFETTPGEVMYVNAVVGVVPEPGALAMLVLPLVLSLRTRRRSY